MKKVTTSAEEPDYADKANKRFAIRNQDDVDKLVGKIRRVKGRDDIRLEAIKIIIKKRLNIPHGFLYKWDDAESEDATMSISTRRYVTKEERDVLSDNDFGYVNGERRLFPIIAEEDVKSALDYLGSADSCFAEEDVSKSVARIMAIATRKGFTANFSAPNVPNGSLVTIS